MASFAKFGRKYALTFFRRVLAYDLNIAKLSRARKSEAAFNHNVNSHSSISVYVSHTKILVISLVATQEIPEITKVARSECILLILNLVDDERKIFLRRNSL